MSILGVKRHRISVSKDDIKKAIKAANDRLKRANKKIERDISDKKQSLASIDKDISIHDKSLKSLLSEIESTKHDAVGAKVEASKERSKLSKLKTQVAEALAKEDATKFNLNKLTIELKLLNKNISEMQDDLSKASTIKEEIKMLRSDKKLEIKELNELNSEANGIKIELSKLRIDIANKKNGHKELFAGLVAEIEDKEGILKNVDKEYSIKMAELNTKIRGLKDHAADKEQEADIMESLVKQREHDYIEIESKCKQAENALMYAQELTNKEIEREQKEKEQIRNRFKQWRVGALEEVARLKLKKKIENIDKAGLSEILNG